jgi:hypothetical protein
MKVSIDRVREDKGDLTIIFGLSEISILAGALRTAAEAPAVTQQQ